MARHAEITLEDIKNAVESIRNLKQRPTVERVLAITQKGSRTTILRMLKEILKEESASHAEVNNAEAIPAHAMAKMNEAFNIIAQSKLEEISSLKKQLEEKDQHIQELLENAEKRESDFVSAQVERQGAVDKALELAGSLKSVTAELSELKKECESLREYKEKFIAQKSRSDSIVEQINDCKERIKELQKQNSDYVDQMLKGKK